MQNKMKIVLCYLVCTFNIYIFILMNQFFLIMEVFHVFFTAMRKHFVLKGFNRQFVVLCLVGNIRILREIENLSSP